MKLSSSMFTANLLANSNSQVEKDKKRKEPVVCKSVTSTENAMQKDTMKSEWARNKDISASTFVFRLLFNCVGEVVLWRDFMCINSMLDHFYENGGGFHSSAFGTE